MTVEGRIMHEPKARALSVTTLPKQLTSPIMHCQLVLVLSLTRDSHRSSGLHLESVCYIFNTHQSVHCIILGGFEMLAVM